MIHFFNAKPFLRRHEAILASGTSLGITEKEQAPVPFPLRSVGSASGWMKAVLLSAVMVPTDAAVCFLPILLLCSVVFTILLILI